MDMVEKLLVVARDAAPFYEYKYQSIVEEYSKKMEALKSVIRACRQREMAKG